MQIISSKTILVTLALVTASFSMSVRAQEFKIGFINTDRIFRDANSAKAAQAKLEQEFSRRE
ncbi:MAG TPA: OmpH family outer membrane protein, partial [Burkholderiaceae bacterium]|nr:OmpH family outer membrane protein [Burkholderiaceae bacterium]